MGKIIEISGKDKINLRARSLMSHSLFKDRVGIIEAMDYKIFVHDPQNYIFNNKTLTIILTANGNNEDYFKESIESVLQQNDKNYELILVDHGCESELRKLIYSYFLANDKIKLIVFEKNLYDPKAAVLIEESFSNILNSALFSSNGDYVYFLSYDDYLSVNYVNNMRELFLQNSKCVAASPAVVSVNENSELNVARTKWFQQNNKRERYMSGIDLATSVITRERLFAAPGGLFCYRSDMVLSAGGLDTLNDFSQIFKFSVLGEVGTCKQAFLYWRHHDNQTNKNNKKLGVIYYSIFVDWINHIEAFYLTKDIDKSYQLAFQKYIRLELHAQCVESIRDGIRSGVKGVVGVFFEIYRTAPIAYFMYFFLFLFIESPYLLYNSMPEEVRKRYRKVKKLILQRVMH